MNAQTHSPRLSRSRTTSWITDPPFLPCPLFPQNRDREKAWTNPKSTAHARKQGVLRALYGESYHRRVVGHAECGGAAARRKQAVAKTWSAAGIALYVVYSRVSL